MFWLFDKILIAYMQRWRLMHEHWLSVMSTAKIISIISELLFYKDDTFTGFALIHV